MTKKNNFQTNLKEFLIQIDAIKDTLQQTIILIHPFNKQSFDDFVIFLKDNVKEIEDDNGKKRFLIDAEKSKVFETLERNASISELASKIIIESLFVSLISHYDAFLSKLLRNIYEIQPEVLNGSERNLTFTQLIEMQTIESAREHIIDKEIDAIIRKSHSEQFDYLEKLLSIKLREKLPIWQTFIEITERRSLLVHCDGIVSNQYLKNCDEHNCNIEKIQIGDRLGIEIDYFIEAYACLYEMATKLTHTLWRKLLITDLENADKELNDICYHLIDTKSFKIADILLEFACNQKKHFDDLYKNVFIVNAALSKYLQNQKEEAKTILLKKDWSACSDNFKLACAVITENSEKAYELMLKIGENGDVDKSNYKEWPLFKKIRKEKKFKETYYNIFKEEYSVLETPMRPIQNLINKIIKKDKELKEKTVKKIESAKELREKENLAIVAL